MKISPNDCANCACREGIINLQMTRKRQGALLIHLLDTTNINSNRLTDESVFVLFLSLLNLLIRSDNCQANYFSFDK